MSDLNLKIPGAKVTALVGLSGGGKLLMFVADCLKVVCINSFNSSIFTILCGSHP